MSKRSYHFFGDAFDIDKELGDAIFWDYQKLQSSQQKRREPGERRTYRQTARDNLSPLLPGDPVWYHAHGSPQSETYKAVVGGELLASGGVGVDKTGVIIETQAKCFHSSLDTTRPRILVVPRSALHRRDR